jgi:hypothetical protein
LEAYFPRDVFFFGLGFPGVCLPAAVTTRFVRFFVAIDPPQSRPFSKSW